MLKKFSEKCFEYDWKNNSSLGYFVFVTSIISALVFSGCGLIFLYGVAPVLANVSISLVIIFFVVCYLKSFYLVILKKGDNDDC